VGGDWQLACVIGWLLFFQTSQCSMQGLLVDVAARVSARFIKSFYIHWRNTSC